MARWRLARPLVSTIAAGALLTVVTPAASGQGARLACGPTAEHRARFIGLPTRIQFGTQEPFKVDITRDLGLTPDGVKLTMRDTETGEVFFSDTVEDQDIEYFVELDRGDPPAIVTITYASTQPTADGFDEQCTGTVSQTVEGNPDLLGKGEAQEHTRRVIISRLHYDRNESQQLIRRIACHRLSSKRLRCRWLAGGDIEAYEAVGVVRLQGQRLRSSFTGTRFRGLTSAGQIIDPPIVLKRFRWTTSSRLSAPSNALQAPTEVGSAAGVAVTL